MGIPRRNRTNAFMVDFLKLIMNSTEVDYDTFILRLRSRAWQAGGDGIYASSPEGCSPLEVSGLGKDLRTR